MGRLSTISDVEQRQAKSAEETVKDTPEQGKQQASEQKRAPEQTPSQAPAQRKRLSEAEQEAAFHGLDDSEGIGGGHKALIGIAIVIVIVIAVYAANYSLHFF